MRKSKKVISMILAATMLFSLTACGSKDGSKSVDSETKATAESSVAEQAQIGSKTADMGLTTIDQIELGTDYQDVSATIKLLTHRTDLVDNVFVDYAKKFNELYPNIQVEFEGITNYADDVTTRLSSSNWGDICMIPPAIDKSEFADYFISYGQLDKLSEKYIFLNDKSYENMVYGIPTGGNVLGMVYNKKVFSDAGITELPKTPDEFLDDLQLIKDKTNAIPLYTNFAAQWTMTAWDAYTTGTVTGDPDYSAYGLVHGKNPFAKRDDMTGPYSVYYILYESVARGLTEDDPTTTDWEGCKPMINNGEIGVMALGSWAVVQMQQAGEHPDDIGYMPFPVNVGGKQYASASPDYCYGINVNAPIENQIASLLFVKWLTEESNFAFDQGSIPIVVGSDYPDVMAAFSDVELVIDNPAKEGEEEYYNLINRDSEVGLNNDPMPDCEIVEHALAKDMTIDDIMAEWNEKWTSGQESNGVEIIE